MSVSDHSSPKGRPRTSMQDLSLVIGIVALPRSGTTVLASVFSVHSRVHCIYEPWNASKTKIDITRPTTLSDFLEDFKVNTGARDVLVVKETATDLHYIRRMTELIDSVPPPIARESIIIFRDPFHVFLSEVQARREWWGHTGLQVSADVFDKWAQRTLQAMPILREMAKRHDAILLSYERFISDPQMLPRLMAEVGLDLEPPQLNYEAHVDTRAVRGDIGLEKNPRPLSSESITRRDAEMQEMLNLVSGTTHFPAIASLQDAVSELAELGVARAHALKHFVSALES